MVEPSQPFVRPTRPTAHHLKNPYDDFAVQPLLLCAALEFGPPLAVADVKWGWPRGFLPGAAIGTPGKLMIQSEGALYGRNHSASQAGCHDGG